MNPKRQVGDRSYNLSRFYNETVIMESLSVGW